MDVENLNGFMLAYLNSLSDQELRLANSIWFLDDPSFHVQESFLQTNADYYGADAYKAAFDEATRHDINQWVKEHTDGMIHEIIDEIPQDAVMYLVNAMAFDAKWEQVYQEYQVGEGFFTTEDGNRRMVDLMHGEEHVYLVDDLATGFLKYYQGRRYAFVALLPKEGVSVSAYVDSLTGEHLLELLSNPMRVTVLTAMPKFETEYEIEMGEALQKLGMTDAFSGSVADFSRMGSYDGGNIRISRVLHKTSLSLGEQGTKAGAATAVEMNAEGAMMMDKFQEVILDRPFVYMLIDCETNLPFFMGTAMDLGEAIQFDAPGSYGHSDPVVDDHNHALAEDPQTVDESVTGYCGNTWTTIMLDGAEYTFMGGDSVELTDILINLNYDSMKVCRCATEFTVTTEFGSPYGMNLTQGYARCQEGQADLTPEQVAQIQKILDNQT